ncbi:Putative HTH-type transcriptional regulator Y4dL [Neorhizobium galegae bv. officinalis]|uniref:Putative HTH-type transcriptional regulator Y4dL n=1 Tax=Neorhizobium galegae bv. officinalis TaxID=323656 RepID=A0A0T7FCP3_NEOGA|nr:helix-turn-helix transcriptional regulator [Neorhizobium galegae]CDZ32786.1 Putative HTH-type transcriptional regulator Y4dL [Neorhizobium galegae bv. officinalis]
MGYKTEHITHQLRAAREVKNMSQRELSARSGLTQSHISQIERGTMEPGLGSLVDVARVLDLEIVLVPKKLMPAIGNILDSASAMSDTLTSEQRKLVGRVDRWLAEGRDRFAITSDADNLKDSLALLRHLPLSAEELEKFRDLAMTLLRWQSEPPPAKHVSEFVHAIRSLRNAAVHRDRDDAVPRSAYALDEEDDDA